MADTSYAGDRIVGDFIDQGLQEPVCDLQTHETASRDSVALEVDFAHASMIARFGPQRVFQGASRMWSTSSSIRRMISIRNGTRTVLFFINSSTRRSTSRTVSRAS